MTRRMLLAAAAVTVTAAGCGGATPGAVATPSPATATPAPAETAPPTAAPSPPPPQSVVALSVDNATRIEFVSETGAVLGSDAPPSGAALFNDVSTTAGSLWYVDTATGHIHRVTADGHDTDVAALGHASGTTFWGLAVSPDGTRWAVGVATNGSPDRAAVLVASTGSSQTILDQATNNPVLAPVAWTQHGLFIARDATGIGGCCYLTPEYGVRDLMEVDPISLTVTSTWNGCATDSVSASGAFACVASSAGGVVAHAASGQTVACTPRAPVQRSGWAIVDETHDRALFGVIHSIGSGGGDGPYIIDTEACDLATSAVTPLFQQLTPDVALADGSTVVSSAPAVLSNGATVHVTLVSPSGTMTQLGPAGARFVAAYPTSSS